MGDTDKNNQFEDQIKPSKDKKSRKPADKDLNAAPAPKKTWEDIIPSLSQPDNKEPDLNPALTDEEKQALQNDNPNPIPIVEISPKSKKSDPEDKKVPEFNLADQIMSEHRKATAKNRKGPGRTEGKTEEALRKMVPQPVEKIKDRRVEENKIIAEIVARDIERLCRPEDSD